MLLTDKMLYKDVKGKLVDLENLNKSEIDFYKKEIEKRIKKTENLVNSKRILLQKLCNFKSFLAKKEFESEIKKEFKKTVKLQKDDIKV